MHSWSRRRFIHLSSAIGTFGIPELGGSLAGQLSAASPASLASTTPSATWPQQDPVTVREMVSVCHANVTRVRELVERQPALANAALDWGYGDWEDALGAASHMGRRDIAELLLAHGARPSIFSAAMLGQLDVVRALVLARPGVQRTYGPHGITLMAHARAGGPDAEAVATYLETLGDADRRLTATPLDPKDRDALVGRYTFGVGPRDHLDVDVQNNQIGINRPDATRRLLIHTGGLAFFPSGVPSVTIAFARADGRVTQLTVADPAGHVTAKKTG